MMVWNRKKHPVQSRQTLGAPDASRVSIGFPVNILAYLAGKCMKNSFFKLNFQEKGDKQMGFFTTSVTGLKTVVTAIGAGVGVWGVINLLEGYGNDNPGAKSQGIKQLMSGGGIIIVAQTVIPQLTTLFS